MKPANTPLYVHRQSNHPPNIIKNIPESVNRRLSEISSDEDAFTEAATPYQEALNKSGYNYTLEFKPTPQRPPSQTRNRPRNVIWFNPPFNKNVKTNIGRQFIRLIDKCFTVGHKLRKIFNRNTLKLSYSCMPNIQQIIDGHNKAILRTNTKQPQDQAARTGCNCRKKNECPLNGECLSKEIVYQAVVTRSGKCESNRTWGLQQQNLNRGGETTRRHSKTNKEKKDTELSKATPEVDIKAAISKFSVVPKSMLAPDGMMLHCSAKSSLMRILYKHGGESQQRMNTATQNNVDDIINVEAEPKLQLRVPAVDALWQNCSTLIGQTVTKTVHSHWRWPEPPCN
ncbi:hypothetical protein ACROYT_G034196 [Oculina patagonica]